MREKRQQQQQIEKNYENTLQCPNVSKKYYCYTEGVTTKGQGITKNTYSESIKVLLIKYCFTVSETSPLQVGMREFFVWAGVIQHLDEASGSEELMSTPRRDVGFDVSVGSGFGMEGE